MGRIKSWIETFFILAAVNLLIAGTVLLAVDMLNVIYKQGVVQPGHLVKTFIAIMVWGMTGAVRSLLASRRAVMRKMRVRILDPSNPSLTSQEAKLVKIVHNQARCAGLSEQDMRGLLIGVFPSRVFNAFATGATPSTSLVALSSAMLERFDESKISAVVGHELGHVISGDTARVVMTQGLLDSFAIFFSWLFSLLDAALSKEKKEVNPGTSDQSPGRDKPSDPGSGSNRPKGLPEIETGQITLWSEKLLFFLAMVLVAALSRWREYKADLASARVNGSQAMIDALEALRKSSGPGLTRQNRGIRMLQIRSPIEEILSGILSTHPSIPERVKRLREANLKPSKCILDSKE